MHLDKIGLWMLNAGQWQRQSETKRKTLRLICLYWALKPDRCSFMLWGILHTVLLLFSSSRSLRRPLLRPLSPVAESQLLMKRGLLRTVLSDRSNRCSFATQPTMIQQVPVQVSAWLHILSKFWKDFCMFLFAATLFMILWITPAMTEWM